MIERFLQKREEITPPKQLDELRAIVQSPESHPADYLNFIYLHEILKSVAKHNKSPDQHYYKEVMRSRYLRPFGLPATSPRIKVAVDPLGEIISNDPKNKPHLSFEIEQGANAWYDRRHPKGAWGLAIDLYAINDSGVQVNIDGSRVNESGILKPLSLRGFSSDFASIELLDWIRDQVGDPEALVPAPTRKEKKLAKTLARRGFQAKSYPNAV